MLQNGQRLWSTFMLFFVNYLKRHVEAYVVPVRYKSFKKLKYVFAPQPLILYFELIKNTNKIINQEPKRLESRK